MVNAAPPHLVSFGGDGIGEDKDGQRQVDEAVLVGLQLPVTLDHLDELQDHQARHRRRGGGDGRDDLAGNQFALVTKGKKRP